jgi:hypothetical protein
MLAMFALPGQDLKFLVAERLAQVPLKIYLDSLQKYSEARKDVSLLP